MPFCGEDWDWDGLRGWKVIQVCTRNKPVAMAIKRIGTSKSETELYQTSRMQCSHFLRRVVY
jgi:hypothetical protein